MAFTRPEWVSHTVSVEDMTAGKNQWRNIQDIVRVTFKEFHDVLRAQGDALNLWRGRLILRPTGRAGARSVPVPAAGGGGRVASAQAHLLGHRTPARLEGRKADVHAAFKAQEELMGGELARKADAEEVERKVNEMDALLAECVERAV